MKRFLVEDDAIDNPKLQLLKAETFRFWMNCCCIANRQKPRGSLPSTEAIGFRTRKSPEETAVMIAELVKARLIDCDKDGCMAMHDWSDHQVEQRNWADIKRKQRAKKKAPGDPSRNGNPGNVHVDVHVDSPPMSTVPSTGLSTSCPQIKEGRQSLPTRLLNTEDEPSDVRTVSSPECRQSCVELAMELLGDGPATAVAKYVNEIEDALSHDPQTWNAVAAAIRAARTLTDKGDKVNDIKAWCIGVGGRFLIEGIPDAPVAVNPKSVPKKLQKARDEDRIHQAPRPKANS